MSQFLVHWEKTGGESGIQSAGRDGFNLVHRQQMMQLQFRVRQLPPESAENICDHSMPGHRGCYSDSQRTGLAVRNALGASFRVLNILEDSSRIGQEQFPRGVQSHSTRQAVEQGESHLSLQILNLPRQGRLNDVEPFRRAPEVLFFRNADKIP
jgi:hypothetical protein